MNPVNPAASVATPCGRYIAIGVVSAIGAACIGPEAQAILLLPICLFGVIAIPRSIRRWRTEQRFPWLALAAMMGLFFIAYILSMLDYFTGGPAEGPGMSTGFGIAANVTALLATVAATTGFAGLGKLRAHHKDPTNMLDALVLSGAITLLLWSVIVIPYLHDTSIPLGDRLVSAAFLSFDFALLTFVARLAIGPGARNPSYYLATTAVVLALLTDLIAFMGKASIAFPLQDQLTLLVPSLALIALPASAMHKSMTDVTRPAQTNVGRMTASRFAMMTVAIFIPPILLLARGVDTSSRNWVVGGWIGMTLLVMIRLSGLVRAQQQVADVEHALSRATASLVSATDRDATYTYALAGMTDLVGKQKEGLRTAVALCTDNDWTVVCADGEGAEFAQGRHLDPTLIDGVLQECKGAPVQFSETIAFDNPQSGKCSTVVAPLNSHGQTRGALLVSTSRPLSSSIVEAIGALASDVSLAVEAVGLAEDLHRRQSEQRFASLVQHSSDLTAVLDQSGKIAYSTPSVEALLGYTVESLMGIDLSEIFHPEDKDVINELASLLVTERSGTRELELRAKTAEGAYKVLEVTLTDLRHDESVNGIVMNAHDITDRKALEEDLRHKVLHDDLTGIANRILFRDRVDHALQSAPHNRGEVIAVLFIDIDDFKTVNDGLGHDLGDELLKVVANRLEAFLRAGDTAARLGGDEFAALFEGLYTLEDVLVAAQRLLTVLNQPVEFGSREITMSASIGVALAETGMTSEVLLRNADVAMYHAKQTGKSRVKLFDEAMYISAFERLELKADLVHALERDEISLHYQPLVSMTTREVIGFEALMRWMHPTRGFVSPASFIPLAEETGLIVELGAWAAREAFRQLSIWRAKFGGHIGMSLNVSPRQLEEEGIVTTIDAAIKEAQVDPTWVTLELTESAGLDDPASRERLIGLRSLGCGVAADDFGTGFASYAALQQLPFTNVKIDRSLINGLSDNDVRAHAQVRSIIQMGHALGLTITAEGIEDAHQADALMRMKADKAQGYLFGRPAKAEDIEEQLSHSAHIE